MIFALSMTVSAQNLSNSIFIGLANGTNVGGTMGVGVEVAITEYLSVSFSIGSIHMSLEEKIDKSKFDFDTGLKLYPIKYLYFGINYGMIDYQYSEYVYANGNIEVNFKKDRGFSFTIGGKTPEYNNFYLSAFIGITNNKNANHGLRGLSDDTFTPRIGMLLGYVL